MKTIPFPADRLMGYLHHQQSDIPQAFHGRYNKDGSLLPDTSNPDWRLLGEATGFVQVPDDVVILLEVLPEEGRDLSPLALLKPDDIDALWLGNTFTNDEQLTFITTLTELLWIDLQNNGEISDSGIAHLKGLKSLRWFGAHWTRISEHSLEVLIGMADLTHIDIWGCEIPTPAIEQFKVRMPYCSVRTE